MSKFYVNITFEVVWQMKLYNEYKVTRCKKVVNELTQKMLVYNKRGYFIKGVYYKKYELNKYLEKIPVENKLPF